MNCINYPIYNMCCFTQKDRSAYTKCIFYCFLFLLMFFEFVLGITEAVFLAKYKELENGCQDIWKIILASCITNILLSLYGMLVLFFDTNKKSAAITYSQSGQTFVAIGAIIIYYNINASCNYFWQTNAHELLIFIRIHFVMFWISIGVIGLEFISKIIDCYNIMRRARASASARHNDNELSESLFNDI